MAETTPKKKNLSPETEAIVNRLKSEGDLVRNSGTNSIKAITINLEKFTDAFAAIQISSEQTAKVLTDSWQGNEVLLQNIDESLNGLDKTEKAAELARRKEAQKDSITNKENKSESIIEAKSLKLALMGGFKGLKDGFMAIKADPWGSLLSIGKWAIIIPVLAGAIKGLLDRIFGEGEMSSFYKKVGESEFGKFIFNNPWTSIGAGLLAMAGIKWGVMYATMMLAAKTMGVGGGGGPDVIGTGGDGPDKKTSKKARFKKILGKAKGKGGLVVGALSLVTIGGVQYMLSDDDEPIDLTADIAKINAAGDAEDAAVTKKLVDTFENERKGFGTILTETLTGAGVGGAIGAVGGGGVGAIPGAIAGAIFGAVSGIGAVGYDFVDDVRNDVDKIPNELEKALKNEKRQNKLSLMYGRDQKAAALTATTTARVQEIIDGLTTSNLADDLNIKALEAGLAGETTNKRIGRSNATDYVMVDGKSVRKSKVIKDLEDAKKERLLREQQLITSRKILEMRTVELKAAEVTVEKTNKLNDQVDEVTAEVKAAKPNIAPSVEERDKKQTVAAGGFALNITNNYISKGGDTMVQNTSDNRVSSQNSTNAVVVGSPGGRFGGGTSLPSGSMA